MLAVTLRLFALLILTASHAVWAEARLAVLTNLSEFTRIGTNQWLSPEYKAGRSFSELVVSWNAPTNVTCQIDAQVRSGDSWGRWWTFARWSSVADTDARTSVGGQQDASGRMDTDTLKLKADADATRLRVTFADASATPGQLQLMALSTWRATATEQAETAKVFKTIEVPIRSQADYPEGINAWCSPTCTAMVLAHWGRILGRTDLDMDVRVVSKGVFDPAWAGTGNWAFNTAFAGSQLGIRACVARLNGIGDIGALIEAGLPVTVSVSYSMLKGASRSRGSDGHLVVVCGFKPGLVVINDPGVRLESVRREFPVEDFIRSWDASHRTAYLVWPDNTTLPSSPSGTW